MGIELNENVVFAVIALLMTVMALVQTIRLMSREGITRPRRVSRWIEKTDSLVTKGKIYSAELDQLDEELTTHVNEILELVVERENIRGEGNDVHRNAKCRDIQNNGESEVGNGDGDNCKCAGHDAVGQESLAGVLQYEPVEETA